MKNVVRYILAVVFGLAFSESFSFSFEGAGTLDDPYKINRAADLSELADSVNSGVVCENIYFLQTSNIDMSDQKQWDNKKTQKKLWIPIGSMKNRFQGHYDGDNKTILNLVIDDDPDKPFVSQTGLFGCIGTNGSLQNLYLENMELHKVYSISGAFCGMNEGVVSNCHTVKSELVCYKVAGGIVGINLGRVTSCTNDARQYGGSIIGGIVGYNYGEISDCENFRGISALLGIGGICGYNGGFNKDAYCRETDNFLFATIINCKNHAVIDGETYTGGITGRNDGSVYNCLNDGKILTDWYVGGIAGANGNSNDVESIIYNCVNKGEIIAREDVAAGICGLNYGNGTIDNVVNMSNVIEKEVEIGINLVYSNEGTVKNAYWQENGYEPFVTNDRHIDSISSFNSCLEMSDSLISFSAVDSITKYFGDTLLPSDSCESIITCDTCMSDTLIDMNNAPLIRDRNASFIVYYAGGVDYIYSLEPQLIEIYNVSGYLITRFWINKSEKRILNLKFGIYLINGKKVVIN